MIDNAMLDQVRRHFGEGNVSMIAFADFGNACGLVYGVVHTDAGANDFAPFVMNWPPSHKGTVTFRLWPERGDMDPGLCAIEAYKLVGQIANGEVSETVPEPIQPTMTEYSDFTIALRDYLRAILNEDEAAIIEAYNRPTSDGTFCSTRDWAETVAGPDDPNMMKIRNRHVATICHYLEFDMKCDEENVALVNDYNDGSGYFYTLRHARGLFGFQIHGDDNAIISRSNLEFANAYLATEAAKDAIRDRRND
jgi:hypothetical protein